MVNLENLFSHAVLVPIHALLWTLDFISHNAGCTLVLVACCGVVAGCVWVLADTWRGK